MLVVMQHDATAKDVDRVVSIIQEMGYEARPMPGAQRTAVGLVGNDGRVDASLRFEYRSKAPDATRLVASVVVTKKIGDISVPGGHAV